MTIRGMPDELHVALKERARRNRRSMNQQVVEELNRVFAGETEEQSRARVEEEVESAKQLRSRMTRFLTAEEIDAAIKEGRR